MIATVADVRKMFSVADGEYLDCTPYLAIGFFAGIRSEELGKLQWEQVDFENKAVVVLSSSAKGRARRIVDISPNLMAWLVPYKKESGPVLEASVEAYRTQMRNAMGYAKWPQNVMRHSFASYHFAKHRNESLLMQLMGHADDGRILHNQYKALVLPNDAEAFWSIFPHDR